MVDSGLFVLINKYRANTLYSPFSWDIYRMDHQLLQSWIEQLVEEEMEVIVQEIRIFAHSRQIFAEEWMSLRIILQR